MKNCIASIVLLLGGIAGGCDDGPPTAPSADSPAIKVIYQSDPVADVQVQLHESENGTVLARAITSTDGMARFTDLPEPEPGEYFVSLESIGDGGWILDPKLMQRFTKTLRLKPLHENSNQSIDLPPRSIQPLLRQTR